MNITILTTQTTTHMNKANKPYQQLEVTYKNNTFGKVESKKLMPFGVQEGAFKALASSQQGDIFEVTVVKNAAGFNDWTEVKQQAPGAVVSPTAPAYGANPTNKGSNTVAVKSTYETPDERAKKQVYIIRQSSISAAINTLSVGSKVAPAVESVLNLAQDYYNWVMQSPEEVVKQDIFSSVNDFPDVE